MMASERSWRLRLYSLLLACVMPVFWLVLWRRSRREGGRWQVCHPHRFARRWQCPLASDRPIWVHAVSLGELRAVAPLIERLLSERYPVLLTHTTATAWQEGQRRWPRALAAGQMQQAWLPYDFAGAQRRFLVAARPRVLLLVEREIWPNLLAACADAQVPTVLINGRLSARSARQLHRWRWWYRPAFGSLRMCLMQSADDAERVLAMGATSVRVVGNLKFDLTPEPDLIRQGQQWRATWQRPVVTLASSREGEEAAWIAAWRADTDDSVLRVLVPRHKARFDEVAGLLAATGAAWRRRTQWLGTNAAAQADDAAPTPPSGGEVAWLLGDSMGEMASYYAASDVVIMGGSFADFGGQNLVEACAAGAPVILGPSVYNFAQVAQDALAAGAAIQVGRMSDAVAVARRWLQQPAERQRYADAARAFVQQHQGATNRTWEALYPWLSAKPATASATDRL